jgi:hypothetical protein
MRLPRLVLRNVLPIASGILVCFSAMVACSTSSPSAPADVALADSGTQAATDALTPETSIVRDTSTDTSTDTWVDASVGDCATLPPLPTLDWDASWADAAPDVGAPSCTPLERVKHLSTGMKEPIIPFVGAAGLKFVTGCSTRLALADVDLALCPGADEGATEPGTQMMSWGDNGEMWAEYDSKTTIVRGLWLFFGYTGKIVFHSPDAQHTYSIGVGDQPIKDATLVTLDWNGPTFETTVDELYRGMLATFAPSVPAPPPGVTCIASKDCTTNRYGQMGYVYFKTGLNTSIWVDDVNAAEPYASIPSRIVLDPPP